VAWSRIIRLRFDDESGCSIDNLAVFGTFVRVNQIQELVDMITTTGSVSVSDNNTLGGNIRTIVFFKFPQPQNSEFMNSGDENSRQRGRMHYSWLDLDHRACANFGTIVEYTGIRCHTVTATGRNQTTPHDATSEILKLYLFGYFLPTLTTTSDTALQKWPSPIITERMLSRYVLLVGFHHVAWQNYKLPCCTYQWMAMLRTSQSYLCCRASTRITAPVNLNRDWKHMCLRSKAFPPKTEL